MARLWCAELRAPATRESLCERQSLRIRNPLDSARRGSNPLAVARAGSQLIARVRICVHRARAAIEKHCRRPGVRLWPRVMYGDSVCLVWQSTGLAHCQTCVALLLRFPFPPRGPRTSGTQTAKHISERQAHNVAAAGPGGAAAIVQPWAPAHSCPVSQAGPVRFRVAQGKFLRMVRGAPEWCCPMASWWRRRPAAQFGAPPRRALCRPREWVGMSGGGYDDWGLVEGGGGGWGWGWGVGRSPPAGRSAL